MIADPRTRYTVSTTMDSYPPIEPPRPFSIEEAEKATRFPSDDEHPETEEE